MSVPKVVSKLVDRFHADPEVYRNKKFKEARLRVEFLDPLLEEGLGWDVGNKSSQPEAYRDVIYEDEVKIGGGTRAPDYGFYLNGQRRFFLEAKKPSVDIRNAIDPALQLRRYAWSAKLPLSILTDFEEFGFYDCRIEPNLKDAPDVARLAYFGYEDYMDRETWERIAEIFSRDAVLAGSLEKYAETLKRRRGTETVDEAFLKRVEAWRAALARDLVSRNDLDGRQLNYAVQMTIDRIVFLRMAEDRGSEPYKRLLDLTGPAGVYDRLMRVFREADDRYNSGLFHFRHERGRDESPDSLTPDLEIGDDVLRDIIGGLYYPQSPYEFSVLPLDILGQVYEQFLGKVIRVDGKNDAIVEAKPEVRKAGGVYYTPTFVVDYIVRKTVGKLLEGKKPGPRGDASSLKIVDPACGSGSFLIGAYTYLLDWHRDRYVEDGHEKWGKQIQKGPGNNWHLTIQEKKRILLNNIYGVDIDPQAVEVTKLSLLLKVLEGENQETLDRQLSLFNERALPDLDGNIRCGNSLIGPDFYNERDLALFEEEDHYRINVFDWRKAFPRVFEVENPGFDAVIGNPPYIRMEAFKELKNYLRRRFTSHDERSDLYSYFVEAGHRILRNDGRFGMIVSNKFLRANYGKPLREFLRQGTAIERIVDFAGLPVFAGATVRTLILLSRRNSQTTEPTIYSPPLNAEAFLALRAGAISVDEAVKGSSYEVSSEYRSTSSWSFTESGVTTILNKLKHSFQPLAEYSEGQIYMGVKSGLTKAFVIDGRMRAEILKENPEAEEIIKPYLGGRDVRRYWLNRKDNNLLYTYHRVDITRYPAVEKYLRPFRTRLEKRATRQEWYELQQPQFRFSPYMEGPKIIFPDIAKAPRFALDDVGYYGANTTYFIPHRDLYLLALLNSKLGEFYFVTTCAGLEGTEETYLRFFGQYLEGFPVRTIDFSDSEDVENHERMVELVERMLNLHERLSKVKIDREKTVIGQQIAATDHQIDRLVYELYELTDEEIEIVESSA